MYLLALLGLLKWTSTAVQKRNSRREQEPKCVPHFLSDFVLLLFVRFLVRLSCQFCPIFCPILSPTFFSDLLLLLYVWSFVRFTGPISCSIFCPIFSANSCTIFLSDILWSFVRFLSDILSDISPYFLVRFFVGFVCPIWTFRFSKTAWTCVNGRLKRMMQISVHKNILRILVDRP